MDLTSIANVITHLKNNRVGIFPCDTIWGLIGLPTKEVVATINALKKSEKSKPLLMLMPSLSVAKKWIAPLSDAQLKFVDLHWPGPLTVIFNKSHKVSGDATCVQQTIAIRVPQFKPLNNLLNKLGQPLVSTSVNWASDAPAKTFKEINPQILSGVSFAINTPQPLHNQPSTIVDLTTDQPKLVRKGVVPL